MWWSGFIILHVRCIDTKKKGVFTLSGKIFLCILDYHIDRGGYVSFFFWEKKTQKLANFWQKIIFLWDKTIFMGNEKL